jgi:hypothetical protein
MQYMVQHVNDNVVNIATLTLSTLLRVEAAGCSELQQKY